MLFCTSQLKRGTRRKELPDIDRQCMKLLTNEICNGITSMSKDQYITKAQTVRGVPKIMFVLVFTGYI